MLLDTNALIWLYLDDERLGIRARARVTAASAVQYSPICVAEIGIKHMLGRLPLPGRDRFPGVFEEMGLRELPFSASHAAALTQEVALIRHDPFDRFLLAQAAVEGCALLTADRTLLDLRRPWIIDARA